MERDQRRRDVLRAIVEGRESLKRKGLTDSDLRLAYCLFGDARTWSVSSLAEATGMSRLTIRSRLAAWLRVGFVTKERRGYRITEAGIERIRQDVDGFLEDNRAMLRKLCAALR